MRVRILARDARVIRHKLLLDENLSPAVGIALRAAGVDVVHVRERGLLGATDAVVLDAPSTKTESLLRQTWMTS